MGFFHEFNQTLSKVVKSSSYWCTNLSGEVIPILYWAISTMHNISVNDQKATEKVQAMLNCTYLGSHLCSGNVDTYDAPDPPNYDPSWWNCSGSGISSNNITQTVESVCKNYPELAAATANLPGTLIFQIVVTLGITGVFVLKYWGRGSYQKIKNNQNNQENNMSNHQARRNALKDGNEELLQKILDEDKQSLQRILKNLQGTGKNLQEIYNEMPDKYTCPISGEIMLYPIQASDGQIYDWRSVQSYMKENKLSPYNKKVLMKAYMPQTVLKNEIDRYIEKIVTTSNVSEKLKETDEKWHEVKEKRERILAKQTNKKKEQTVISMSL